MQTNTLQTLIEYTKDISGLSNVSDEKVIRALNFAVDNYSYLKILSSGTWKWDSILHGDLARVTLTSSAAILPLEDEMTTVRNLEVLVDSKYHLLTPIDQRDTNISLSELTTGASYPKYFDLDGRFIRLYPNPGTSFTYRLTYSRLHPRFSTDNLESPTGVEPIDEEYLALYAADKLMLGTNDPNRVHVRAELSIKERQIKDLTSKRDQTGPLQLKAKINIAT